jgi:hypothetical protein
MVGAVGCFAKGVARYIRVRVGYAAAMADEFNALVKKYSPKVQQLARKTRRFVQKELPGAVEQVKAGWHAVWYGMSPAMSDIVVVIHIRDAYVNLEFAQGASLRDPEKLLEGTGKNMRHVKIRDATMLEKPAFMALVREAIAKGDSKKR